MIREHLTRQNLVSQLSRYGLVAIAVACLYFLVMGLLAGLVELASQISLAIAFFCAAGLNFGLNRRLTFQSPAGYAFRTPGQGWRFLAVAGLVYGLTAAAMAYLPERLGIPDLAVFFIVACIVPVFTFVSLRAWVFRPRRELAEMEAPDESPRERGSSSATHRGSEPAGQVTSWAVTRWSRALGPARGLGARASVVARTHYPLLIVLGLGIALRVAVAMSYRPTYAALIDSIVYLQLGFDELFSDPFRLAGYPVVLRVLRWLGGELYVVISFQYLLGLASAALLYVAVLRSTGSRWLGAVPAAALALSLDQIVLEHSIMTEAFYTFLIVGGTCAALLSGSSSHQLTLLIASGLLLGYASVTRSAGIAVIVVTVAWLLARRPWDLRTRGLRAAVVLVPALGVILVYIVSQGTQTDFWGLNRASGWVTYMRVAPVANCDEFDPPSGTEFLCEPTPVFAANPADARPGPAYYQYVAGPAIARFGNPFLTDGAGSDVVGRFGRAVVIHQPDDYLREVGRDLVRYIWPQFGYDRPWSGPPAEELDISRRAPEAEEPVLAAVADYGFGSKELHISRGVNALQDLQSILRLDRIGLVIVLTFGILGIALGHGPVRWAAILFLAVGVVQAAVAAFTLSWGFRYGIPSLGPLLAAFALGIAAISDRLTRSGPKHTPA